MNALDLYCFNLLKKKVTTTFLIDNNAPKLIEDWKGEEIIAFQEDLFIKVKGRVSEKWFYTYFKNSPTKLPRIDMLNLLSTYVGEKNWHEFVMHHQPQKKKYKFKGLVLIMLLIFSIIFFLFTKNSYNTFNFCFVDGIKNEAITKTFIDIKVLQEDESPLYFKTDSLGCFQYQTKKEYLKFVVQSPYHKSDTIIRSIHSNHNTMVKVFADEYALLLDYYANGNIKKRAAHKLQLHKLIDDEAKIYQFFGNDIGIEVYNKEDFIRLTTMPSSTVKRIKILEKKMKKGKIITLKFMVR